MNKIRLLHTSDWHLGKRLERFPRHEEQIAVLNEICDAAERENIDVVLEALSKGITAKFLHGPQQALHQATGDERARLAALLPQLFRTKR